MLTSENPSSRPALHSAQRGGHPVAQLGLHPCLLTPIPVLFLMQFPAAIFLRMCLWQSHRKERLFNEEKFLSSSGKTYGYMGTLLGFRVFTLNARSSQPVSEVF